MTQENSGKHVRGRQRELMGYIASRDGKHVTIVELEKAFKGRYSHNQIMGTMARVCNSDLQAKYHYPVEKVTHGVWRFVTDMTAEVQETKPAEQAKHEPEPVKDEQTKPDGVVVRARNGVLYVDDQPSDLEVFVMGLRIAVKVS